MRWFSRRKEVADGVFLRGSAIVCREQQGERVVLDTADIQLPGVHNIENYMAAIAAVDGLVPDETIRDFARTFGGVEHRIELVRELRRGALVQRLHRLQPQPHHRRAPVLPGEGHPHRRGQGQGHLL